MKPLTRLLLHLLSFAVGFAACSLTITTKRDHIGGDWLALSAERTFLILGKTMALGSVDEQIHIGLENGLGNQIGGLVGDYPDHPSIPHLTWEVKSLYLKHGRELPRSLSSIAEIRDATIEPKHRRRYYFH